MGKNAIDPRQTPGGFFIGQRRRFRMAVAAGGDQQIAAEIVHDQFMERGSGQHDPDFAGIVGIQQRQRFRRPLQQHDGGGGRGQQFFLNRGDGAIFPDGFQGTGHQRQRFFRTVFEFAQFTDRRIVARVSQQLKSADSLYCRYAAGFQYRQCGLQ